MNQGYAEISVFEKFFFWSGVAALAPIAAWLLVIGIYGTLSFFFHLM
jgi:hypothetical protein